jgi:hypothetical protein
MEHRHGAHFDRTVMAADRNIYLRGSAGLPAYSPRRLQINGYGSMALHMRTAQVNP